MLIFLNFCCPPSKPAFRPHFFGPWAENRNSPFNIFCLVLSFLKRSDTTPLPRPNITCEDLSRPWKFHGDRSIESKVFCCYGQTDGRTHGRMDSRKQTASRPQGNFLHVCVCEGDGVKQLTVRNLCVFTSWRIKMIVCLWFNVPRSQSTSQIIMPWDCELHNPTYIILAHLTRSNAHGSLYFKTAGWC